MRGSLPDSSLKLASGARHYFHSVVLLASLVADDTEIAGQELPRCGRLHTRCQVIHVFSNGLFLINVFMAIGCRISHKAGQKRQHNATALEYRPGQACPQQNCHRRIGQRDKHNFRLKYWLKYSLASLVLVSNIQTERSARTPDRR